MTENKYTTIVLKKETKALLDKLKIHHNQSYDEVLRILLKAYYKKED